MRMTSYVFLVAGAIFQSASPDAVKSQETCDSKVVVTFPSGGARLLQMLYCGDANQTIEFICVKGSKTIHATLPLAPFESKEGDTFKVKFTVGKKIIDKTLKVVPPVAGGAGDQGAALSLEARDPLWQALTKPGADIFTGNGDYTTNVGTLSNAAAKLMKFRRACGL